MARRVFISFLGTGDYKHCIYDLNGERSRPVRFIQEVLVGHYCKHWTKEDRIFIFCTSEKKTGKEGSKEKNWFGEKGLQGRLSALQLQVPVEEIDIKAGFSEKEIWQIFDTVYSQLLPGDKIYFDVTHAFRSIPIFSTVLFNFSKFMKDTRLMTIHYGAYEARNGNPEVAPVIDLTNIVRLQEYNQVASGLKDFGRVKKLKDIIVEGRNLKADKAVAQLGESISELEEYIATIELDKIREGTFIRKFRDNLPKVQNVLPIKTILEEIKKETQDFVGSKDYKNIEAAINWTIKHDMLMQTYPLAEEYIILRVKEELEEEMKEELGNRISDFWFRKYVAALLGMDDVTFQDKKEWDRNLFRDFQVAEYIADCELVWDLRPLYRPVSRLRNSLAHADSDDVSRERTVSGERRSKYDKLRDGIGNLIECLTYLNPPYRDYPSTKYIRETICSSI